MYKTKTLSLLIFLAIIVACNNSEKPHGKIAINIFDAAANQLIDSNASIEILAQGFNWSEGPVWVDDLNTLLFSDVPENKIYKWSEKDSISVFLDAAGHTSEGNEKSNNGPNGLLLDYEGDLLICQHGDRRIALLNSGLENPQHQFISIADKYEGKDYNSPNDLTIDSLGNLYFTDPPYGQPDQKTAEIGVNGVYRVKRNGEVQRLVDTLFRPNGIGISSDEKTLYINNSDPENSVLYAYTINEEGKLINGKVLFDSNELLKKAEGLPDGLKVHSSGNIFATGPGGVLIISPEGKHLATISTGRATANCCFDTDENYLYITADDVLMRVKLKK
ncbi:MAG: SMP-30/gluconolactonase/LRE family protein [Bacteroidales bacterium]|nr:SMP-30/gluconolactonase/LRE family protein [Bacteroidales bacterium]